MLCFYMRNFFANTLFLQCEALYAREQKRFPDTSASAGIYSRPLRVWAINLANLSFREYKHSVQIDHMIQTKGTEMALARQLGRGIWSS